MRRATTMGLAVLAVLMAVVLPTGLAATAQPDESSAATALGRADSSEPSDLAVLTGSGEVGQPSDATMTTFAVGVLGAGVVTVVAAGLRRRVRA